MVSKSDVLLEWINYVVYCVCAVTVIVFLYHCFPGSCKKCRQTAEVTLEVDGTSNPDCSTANTKDGRHSSSAVPQENNSVRMSSVYQSLIPSSSERQSVYECLDQEETPFTDIYENLE